MISPVGGLGDFSMQAIRPQGRTRNPSFEDFDLNGDRAVSREEFSEVLTGAKGNANNNRIGEMFDRLDANRDNSLTRDELSAFRERRDRMMEELRGHRQDILTRAFGSETAATLRGLAS